MFLFQLLPTAEMNAMHTGLHYWEHTKIHWDEVGTVGQMADSLKPHDTNL
jgi:hypothetical protein